VTVTQPEATAILVFRVTARPLWACHFEVRHPVAGGSRFSWTGMSRIGQVAATVPVWNGEIVMPTGYSHLTCAG